MKRNKKLSSKGKRKTFCPIPNSLCHSLSLLPLPACAVVIFYQSTRQLEVVVSRLMHKKISQPAKKQASNQLANTKKQNTKEAKERCWCLQEEEPRTQQLQSMSVYGLLKPVEHFSTRSLPHNLYSMWPPHLHEQARLLLL